MPAPNKLQDNGSDVVPRTTLNFVNATFTDNASENRTDVTVGDITGVTAGTGVSGGGTSGTVTVNVAENYLRVQETTLTNAQVLALRATPITVVTAPGAGKWCEFISASLIFDRTAAYTETTDNLAIKYVNGSGTAASATIETTGFVDAAGDAITLVGPVGTPPIVTAAGELSNAALVIHNTGDGEFGGGNAANTIKVVVSYRVHTTGL